MNPCELHRTKLLESLQAGISFTDNGERKEIGYQEILKFYCRAKVPRTLFLDKYKSLPPIEAYPVEEKQEWKKFVNEIFAGEPPQFRLEAVKIIYTIGILTN